MNCLPNVSINQKIVDILDSNSEPREPAIQFNIHIVSHKEKEGGRGVQSHLAEYIATILLKNDPPKLNLSKSCIFMTFGPIGMTRNYFVK